MPRKEWTDEEYLITMYLYRFGYDDLGMNYTQIAEIMGRTPNSIIMRFGNYLAVENGKSGLNGGGRKSHEMYEKYKDCSREELRKIVIKSLINLKQ